MLLRTEYKAQRLPLNLSPERPLTLIGSCFSDNIGDTMRRCGWDVCVNPCGTLFNPVSIAGHLLAEPYTVELEGFSFSFPTTFYSGNAMAEARRNLQASLHRSQALIATFGTAIAYEKDGFIVANCHKRPAAEFKRRLLTIEEIVEKWTEVIRHLRKNNPGLAIVLTVSPVRHVREGFEENSASKATLLLACRKLCETQPDTFYFPAFEIVNDDLRDYRFFQQDLVHPSQMAVDYIWEKFRDTFLDTEAQKIVEAGLALRRRKEHRFIHPESPEAQRFRRDTEKAESELLASHPTLRF